MTIGVRSGVCLPSLHLCTLCTLSHANASAQHVTFSRDIAPIVFDACVSCHRTGGPGPFPLTTYDEVRRRATQIAQVTRTRFMPPWKVTPEVGHFVGQRLLTDREIALIDQWATNGTPEGDPQALPAAAETRRWLAARQARSDRQTRRGVLAARATDRRLPHLRDQAAGHEADLRDRHRIPSRQRARRASRQHPHRSHADRRAGWTTPIRFRATTA